MWQTEPDICLSARTSPYLDVLELCPLEPYDFWLMQREMNKSTSPPLLHLTERNLIEKIPQAFAQYAKGEFVNLHHQDWDEKTNKYDVEGGKFDFENAAFQDVFYIYKRSAKKLCCFVPNFYSHHEDLWIEKEDELLAKIKMLRGGMQGYIKFIMKQMMPEITFPEQQKMSDVLQKAMCPNGGSSEPTIRMLNPDIPLHDFAKRLQLISGQINNLQGGSIPNPRHLRVPTSEKQAFFEDVCSISTWW